MMPRPVARSMASRSPGTRTSSKDTRQRQINRETDDEHERAGESG